MANRNDFWRRYYGALIGARIESVALEIEEHGDPYPVLMVTLLGQKTKTRLEVLADPEGNGPGFISGLPRAFSTKEAPKG